MPIYKRESHDREEGLIRRDALTLVKAELVGDDQMLKSVFAPYRGSERLLGALIEQLVRNCGAFLAQTIAMDAVVTEQPVIGSLMESEYQRLQTDPAPLVKYLDLMIEMIEENEA